MMESKIVKRKQVGRRGTVTLYLYKDYAGVEMYNVELEYNYIYTGKTFPKREYAKADHFYKTFDTVKEIKNYIINTGELNAEEL